VRLLVLACALALVLIGPAQSRPHGTHVVSSAAQLERVIEKDARPGDRITFSAALDLRIPNNLFVKTERLTIDGHTAAGGRATLRGSGGGRGEALSVDAAGVTLTGLRLVDLPVVAGAVRGDAGADVHGPAGLRVVDNVFESTRSLAHGLLDLTATSGARVQRNEFIRKGGAGVELLATQGTLFERNTIRGGTAVSGLSGDADRGLAVISNTLEGTGMHFTPYDARILDNTVVARPGGRGIFLEGKEDEDGTMRVRGNTVTVSGIASGILMLARLAEVVGNTVRAGGGRNLTTGINVFCDTRRRSTFDVRDNTATGLRRGIVTRCAEGVMIVEDNTLTGNAQAGLTIEGGKGIRVVGGTARGNGAGVIVQGKAQAHLRGVRVQSNRGAGVFADAGTRVHVERVVFGGNGGPGIDIAPRGITPNHVRKLGNDDRDWPLALEFVKKTGKLRGLTCRGCRVDVWEAEDGDENGEGIRLLGQVTAAASGLFTFPRGAAHLDCPDSGKVTVTITTRGADPVTSEFSQDVECACVISSEFMLDGARVPPTGFVNFGVTFGFPQGTKVGEATLTDTRTELRPADTALGPQLQWDELRNEGTPAGAGYFGVDFFVNTYYRKGSAGNATGPRVVWKFSVSYDPPKGSNRCAARLVGAPFLPPG
jgi:hypothetical protein